MQTEENPLAELPEKKPENIVENKLPEENLEFS